jgi:hypothetical protein
MDPCVQRRMNLLWGVIPRLIDAAEYTRPQDAAQRHARELNLAQEGQTILLLAGFGSGEPTITVLPV